ncbi:hypothetical protein GKZ68_10490 [Hymenobacter sp. BRD128]|uniref:hypothetical protein n=1 Tax=Hymenobacter sp. BRD128 TaxID=2675878 RepID=UPI0015638CD9|nr:hypothetical protein [Hymenobacter sp. BRD128]QKG57017.1 hypothetical protein GKZ68_10490 [Hymenobacter sp. BRD128]
MARTFAAITAELDTAKAGFPALAPLNSPSATSIWGLLRFIVATAAQTLETLWDRHTAEVDAIVARAAVGTPGWYADRAKEFQKDDGSLAVQPSGAIGYATNNPAARIITQATAKENSTTGKLFIKVAKAGAVAGALAPLSAPELVEVKGYFDRIRFAGTRLEVVSRDADRLQVSGTVYYDPLLDVPTVQAAVLKAAQAYLASLDFDGQVYVSRLTDYLQAVPGVKDVAPLHLAARVGTAAPLAFDRLYETQAGYIILEDTPGAGLLNTLQFVPNA